MSIAESFARIILAAIVALPLIAARADNDDRLKPEHWFDLETVSDPQISPNGERIVYVRRYNDIMVDRAFSNLWIINSDGSRHRPLTTGKFSDSSPRWSHDGTRIAFTSNREERSQIFVYFLDDGQLVRVTNTPKSPSGLTWSRDDSQLAFTMPVDAKPPKGVDMPKKPKGAKWADPPTVIEKPIYRFNGRGYLPDVYRHIFVVPTLGGTPRKLTDGDWDHGSPSWSADGGQLYFSATRKPDAEWVVQDSELYSVDLAGKIEQITDRRGPDNRPLVSPDGKWIAYTGFDDGNFSSTITRLYICRPDGSDVRCLTPDLDRSAGSVVWSPAGDTIFFSTGDRGSRNIHAASLAGKLSDVTNGVQQLRGFTVALQHPLLRFATIYTDSKVPGDVATIPMVDGAALGVQRLTKVNDDILAHRKLGKTEEIWYKSSFDQRDIQGWIVTPPDFDPAKKYPLILYIHGGPHAMYGVNFNFEFQAHAANDYVIFYCNPRGSTGYGKEFANIIQYNYPGDDFFDLDSGVDEVIKRGYIDEENMFVTGGSGGGVLTCWVIGRTDRFAAAASQYPVINWYSFVLTCDISAYVHKRWFKGYPWEAVDDHMKRSPISLVGNVTTPCLLITGELDWRTPISETEQYYQALRLQKKEAKMVRMPNEAHGVRGRPSHYIAKMLHIQEWFEQHKRGAMSKPPEPDEEQDEQD